MSENTSTSSTDNSTKLYTKQGQRNIYGIILPEVLLEKFCRTVEVPEDSREEKKIDFKRNNLKIHFSKLGNNH